MSNAAESGGGSTKWGLVLIGLLLVAATFIVSPPVAVGLLGLSAIVWRPEYALAFSWAGLPIAAKYVPEGMGLAISLGLIALLSGLSLLRKNPLSFRLPIGLVISATGIIVATYLLALNTAPPAHAVDRPAQFLAGALVIPATLLVVRTHRSLARYLWALVAIGVTLGVAETLRVMNGGIIHAETIAFDLNPISLARITMIGGLSALWLLSIESGKAARLLLFVSGAVCVSGTIYSGSRAPMVGLLVAVALVAIVHSWKTRIATVIIVPLVASYLGAGEGVQRLTETDASEGNVSDRLESWRAAFETFSTAPLTGAGVGRYWEGATTAVLHLDYPHNLFLEVASELGVFVFAALVLLFIAAWRKAALQAKAMLLAVLMVVSFSGHLGTAQIVWAVCSLVIATNIINKNSVTQPENQDLQSLKDRKLGAV